MHFAMDYLYQRNRWVARELGPGPTVAQPPAEREITAEGKDVVVIGGGDTGADCVGNALREGARSVIQLELLSEPPPQRPDDRTPWPQWPLKYRLSYAMEEAQELGRGRAGLLGHDDPLRRRRHGAVAALHIARAEPAAAVRAGRGHRARAACTAGAARDGLPRTRAGAARPARGRQGPARQRQGRGAIHDLGRRRVRRRRRTPRPVADRVGDQRGPPVRAHGRPLPRGSVAGAAPAGATLPQGRRDRRPRRCGRRPRGPAAARRPRASARGAWRPRQRRAGATGISPPMPTFCRHNRFIERCPICSKTLPGRSPARLKAPREPLGARRSARGAGAAGAGVAPAWACASTARTARGDDGYRSELVPGLRASSDAMRLAEELAFSTDGCWRWRRRQPGLYGEARALAASDLEQASWMCFLIAYLSPLEGEDPFAGIRLALTRGAPGGRRRRRRRADLGEPPDLDGVPLGPRTSHDPARGADTLLAYRLGCTHRGQPAPGRRRSGPQASGVHRRPRLEPAAALRPPVRAARAARLRPRRGAMTCS